MPYRHGGDILAIEDTDEDFELLELTLRGCGVANRLLRLADGEAAQAYIAAATDAAAGPALILLDLNLPGVDGRDLLCALRARPALRATPVLVLSTSNYPRDVRFCYAHGANCYLVKPLGLEAFEQVVGKLAAFWLDAAELTGGG